MQNRLDTNFQSNQYKLLGFVRSKIQSVEEAEDLVQDVYLQAMQSLNVLDAVDNLAGRRCRAAVWFGVNVALELADAGYFWASADYLLEGVGPRRFEPHIFQIIAASCPPAVS